MTSDYIITDSINGKVLKGVQDLEASVEELYEITDAITLADELCEILAEYDGLPLDIVNKAKEYLAQRNSFYGEDSQLELDL